MAIMPRNKKENRVKENRMKEMLTNDSLNILMNMTDEDRIKFKHLLETNVEWQQLYPEYIHLMEYLPKALTEIAEVLSSKGTVNITGSFSILNKAICSLGLDDKITVDKNAGTAKFTPSPLFVAASEFWKMKSNEVELSRTARLFDQLIKVE